LIQVAEQRRVHVRVVKLELKKITFSLSFVPMVE
jgi:hypothetical protein